MTSPSPAHNTAHFHAAAGADLIHYTVDIASGRLTRHGTVQLPAPVQYVWQHRNNDFLYVVSSNGGPGGGSGAAPGSNDTHHATAFRIEPSGELVQHGPAVALPLRPIHTSTDETSEYLLTVYSDPVGLTVHKINADGTLGAEVRQRALLNLGIFPHQIRSTPSNRHVFMVARGHNPTTEHGEIPGVLKVFSWQDGQLTEVASIAPNGGYGFGPRHFDFHPSAPWMVVSLERQNQLCVFALQDEIPGATAMSYVDTLRSPPARHPRQMASTVRFHRNGRFVYGAERVNSLDVSQPGEIAGEDTLVVCHFDGATGALKVVQRIDTAGRHPRTLSIDPSGRVLIAGCKSPVPVCSLHSAQGVEIVPACLDVFAIGHDGQLSRMHTEPVDVGTASMFWSGFVRPSP